MDNHLLYAEVLINNSRLNQEAEAEAGE